MSYCVYKHTFLNGKVYIGITCQKPEYRWDNGNGYLKKKGDKYCQPLIAKAILKYGWDNVEHDILFSELNKKDAENKEIELITKYQSNRREFGYNIENGGSAIGKVSEKTKRKISESTKGEKSWMYGRHLSEETKRKISMANSGENHCNYGRHLSEETRRKISEAQIGKIISEESRKKMSEAKKGEKHNNYGKHLSEETRRKISEAHIGMKASEESRKKMSMSQMGNTSKPKISVRCIETGIVYDSMSYASKKTGVRLAGISECCNGKQKTAGGFRWEFVDEELRDKVVKNKVVKQGKLNRNSRSVRCVETGVIYESISRASKEINVSSSKISLVCHGKRNKAGGYHWEFAVTTH